jgi:hypothetical protein
LSFKVNFKVIFGVQKLFFGLECQRFAFFVTKTIRFLTCNFLNSKLPFVLFGFRYFLVFFERICFYFHFNHSDVRIKQIVSFRYRNELKIRPKKRIGFMHLDITSLKVEGHCVHCTDSGSPRQARMHFSRKLLDRFLI